MIVNNISIHFDKIQKPICLSIGNFDGIHQGHKYIIDILIKESRRLGLKAAVLSFNPHPRQFFNQNFKKFNITTESYKEELLSLAGVDIFYKLEFDEEVASLTPEYFINHFLIEKLNLKSLIIGENFRFGKDRKGNIDLLKKLSKEKKFDLHIIKSQKSNETNEVFSSTRVREYIKEGNVDKVIQILNRPWNIKGIVQEGDKRARQMNFPTANLLSPKTILPKKGVYVVNVIYNSKNYSGIANFGIRPTFDSNNFLLEVNIFDFNEEIYGKELTVEFLAFIRDEKKFENLEKLKEQVEKDVQSAKSYFVNNIKKN